MPLYCLKTTHWYQCIHIRAFMVHIRTFLKGTVYEYYIYFAYIFSKALCINMNINIIRPICIYFFMYIHSCIGSQMDKPNCQMVYIRPKTIQHRFKTQHLSLSIFVPPLGWNIPTFSKVSRNMYSS